MTRLLVRYPASYEPERRYAIDVVLGTLLGLDHRAEPHDGAATAIALEGAGDGRKVTVADGLFALPESEWLEPASLPAGPLPRWRVTYDLPEALTAGVELAKRVLEHPRAALVVGSHAHRPQGYLNHDGKRAYFCLGNFLMPNLVVLPPINSAPDTVSVKPVQSTRRYHRVSRPTLKRWMSVNRLSLLVRFDPATGEVGHRVLVQADARPAVRELSGLPAALVSAWVELLSLLFRVPAPIYRVLHLANLAITRASWKAAIRLWLAKEMGLGRALRKVLGRLMPRAR